MNSRNVALYALLLIAIFLLAIFGLSVCNNADAASRYLDIDCVSTKYVDTETGVVYFMIEKARGMSNMMSVVPRYNPDGTLYIASGY